jgi:hypothetical protein
LKFRLAALLEGERDIERREWGRRSGKGGHDGTRLLHRAEWESGNSE